MVAHSIHACVLNIYLAQYYILNCRPDLQGRHPLHQIATLALPGPTALACHVSSILAAKDKQTLCHEYVSPSAKVTCK